MERCTPVKGSVMCEQNLCIGDNDHPYELCCEINTVRYPTGQKHILKHVDQNPLNVARLMEIKDGDDLVSLNHVPVAHWDHHFVVSSLSQLSLSEDYTLSMIVRRWRPNRSGQANQYVLLELSVSFSILLDRGSLFPSIRVGDIALKITERIAIPDVLNVKFKGVDRVYIKHAAMTDQFLCVNLDNMTLEMNYLDKTNKSYTFRRYVFDGQDHEESNKPVYLCAIQNEQSGRFLCAQLHTDEIKLDEVQVETGIHKLTKPDPRIFSMTVIEEGTVLRSSLYTNYYLFYDKRVGLRLKRSTPSPTDELPGSRNFCFEIFEAKSEIHQ